MSALHAEGAAPLLAPKRDDQAAGLRRLLGAERRRMLPVASVLSARSHEALASRLRAALAPHGCALRVLDEPADWDAARGHDVFVALAGDFESATAAYALVKAAVASHGKRRFQLLFHGAPGRAIVSRFKRVTERFLAVDVRVAGVLARQPGARSLAELAAKLADADLPELSPSDQE